MAGSVRSGQCTNRRYTCKSARRLLQAAGALCLFMTYGATPRVWPRPPATPAMMAMM